MTLLIDNQLPPALARHLAAAGLDCVHVQDIGLEAADDATIWRYAKQHKMTIVTKDEDFQALATRGVEMPPQVVWVRLGNCRKVALLAAFSKVLPALRAALAAGDVVVEIR